jgi:hypothetical protein
MKKRPQTRALETNQHEPRTDRDRLASRRGAQAANSLKKSAQIPWPQPCLPEPGELLRLKAQGSVWQLSGEDSVQSKEVAASGEAGFLTDLESRLADTHIGKATNLDEVGNDEQRMKELADGLREIKMALDEMRAEWAMKPQNVTGLSAEECFMQLKAGQMTDTEARMTLFDGESEEEAFRFEQLMGNTYMAPMDRVDDLVENWRRNQDDERLVEDLAGLMRYWEQDELNRIREEQEQEREEDAAVRLVTRTWDELRQLMRRGRQVED